MTWRLKMTNMLATSSLGKVGNTRCAESLLLRLFDPGAEGTDSYPRQHQSWQLITARQSMRYTKSLFNMIVFRAVLVSYDTILRIAPVQESILY